MKKGRVYKKSYCIEYALIVSAVFLLGLLSLKQGFKESWRLLWFDVRSGFTDAVILRNRLLLFLFCVILFGILLHENLFGRLRLCWKIRIGRKEWNYCGGKILREHPMTAAAAAAVLLGIGAGLCGKEIIGMRPADTWKAAVTIGHSFGETEGYTYTGSLEAFLNYYELGQRTFEVDLAVTSDNRMVLKHDWDFPEQGKISGENIPTEEVFLENPIYGRFTPLTFEDLCRLMKEYPDVWIVTDSKSEEPEAVKQEFELLVRTAYESGCEDVLDRMVVQVYSERMYECLRENFSFSSYIFTLYQAWYGRTEELLEICRYCAGSGIETIAFQDSFYDAEKQAVADRYGIRLYLHTVNDAEAAKRFRELGVAGVYTDSIVPAMLEENG